MTAITEDYVSFEIAKLLKEKGFDAQCRAAYTNYGQLFTTQIQQYITNIVSSKGYQWECVAPTLQMAMKWLREVHHMIIMLQPLSFNIIKDYLCENWTYSLWADDNLEIGEPYDNQTSYPSYEEACEAAIKYCLENLI